MKNSPPETPGKGVRHLYLLGHTNPEATPGQREEPACGAKKARVPASPSRRSTAPGAAANGLSSPAAQTRNRLDLMAPAEDGFVHDGDDLRTPLREITGPA